MSFTQQNIFTSKAHLYTSHVKMRLALNPKSSEKPTYHIRLHIDPEQFFYAPGDTVAILPKNFEEDIECFLNRFPSNRHELYTYRELSASLEELVSYHLNLNKLTKKLLDYVPACGPTSSLKEFLSKLPQEMTLDQVLPLFARQTPRFYSIASSMQADPTSLDLMVADLEYEVDGVKHKGVGSSYLCERIALHSEPLYMYMQPAKTFCLYDEDRPMILIGPGTGFAPFRSFLQERYFLKSQQEAWLFFGARHRETDFFFEEELKQMQKQLSLRIDAAFSRDQEHKVYVQHLMWENRKDLWDWIENKNALIYVCGDATKMAKDVHNTLLEIAQSEKQLTSEEANNFFKQLKKENRYLLDVY